METASTDIRRCSYCGKPLLPHKRGDAKYCDNYCRHKAWEKKKEEKKNDTA